MAYANTIEYLKNALGNYSAEEETLSKLYKQAAKNAEDNYNLAMKELENKYADDRNAAYADTARSDRNTGVFLAERGLGFSGESAQAKLNSNIALAGRLGSLASEKSKSERQLALDLSNQKSNLSMDEAEKLRNIIESKNGLISNIAGMELDYETEQAKLASEAEKLRAEQEMHYASIQADKEMHNASIQADRDMHNASIEADREMHNASLRADMDRLEAELNAKYNAVMNSQGSNSESSGNKDYSSSDKNTSGDTSSDGNTSAGYIPDITSKELAKQLIGSATEDGRIDSIHDRYNVNRYLLELTENYNVDESYMNDLIFMLKSYGYEETSKAAMKREIISYEAYDVYGETYDRVYEREIALGTNEGAAMQIAKSEAQESKLEYAFSRCDNIFEFRICCEEMGFSKNVVEEYIAEHKTDSGILANKTDRIYGGITGSSQ